MKACDSLVAPKSTGDAESIARLYSSIGVGIVFVEARDHSLAREYTRIFRDYGIEAFSRITIEVYDWRKSVHSIREYSREYDIVSVKPKTVEAARLATRDPDTRIIQFPLAMARYMDKSQALLMREGSAVAEVKLSPLLYSSDPRRSLRRIMVLVRRAAAYEIPLVLGSGATSVWKIWHPWHVVALLYSFGLPLNTCKSIVFGNCRLAV